MIKCVTEFTLHIAARNIAIGTYLQLVKKRDLFYDVD